jgi:hypothetical protein
MILIIQLKLKQNSVYYFHLQEIYTIFCFNFKTQIRIEYISHREFE